MSSASVARIASPDVRPDVEALAALRFRWRHDESGEAGDLASFTPAFATWWHDHTASHVGLLALEDDVAVGMAWLAIMDRVPGPERFRRASGMVQSVYVVPEARGRGVAAALVELLVATARERGLDYLGVHPSERSYTVYERAGFHLSGGVLELGLTRSRRPAP